MIVGYSILIRNLRTSTTPETVKEAFSQFGRIRDVYLPLDYNSGLPRGFGFVEFYERDDAQEALKVMNEKELDGSVISCSVAQDRRKSPNSMRKSYQKLKRVQRYQEAGPYQENYSNGYDRRRDTYRGERYRSRGRYDGYRGDRYERRGMSEDRGYDGRYDGYRGDRYERYDRGYYREPARHERNNW